MSSELTDPPAANQKSGTIPPAPPLSTQTDLMACQSFLQAMYKEQCDQSRQHETQRQQSTTVIIALAGAMLTFATAMAAGTIVFNDALLRKYISYMFLLYSLIGFAIIELSILGRSLSLKHYERAKRHNELARDYRRKLEEMFPFGEKLRNDADNRHEGKSDKKGEFIREFGESGNRIIHTRLYSRWAAIYKSLFFMGAVYSIVCLAAALLLWAKL